MYNKLKSSLLKNHKHEYFTIQQICNTIVPVSLQTILVKKKKKLHKHYLQLSNQSVCAAICPQLKE